MCRLNGFRNRSSDRFYLVYTSFVLSSNGAFSPRFVGTKCNLYRVPYCTCASMLICIVAVLAIFALNLHKIMVYRLTLYQILSAVLLGTLWITKTVVNDVLGHSPSKTVSGFVVYALFYATIVTKVILNAWVVFHLLALSLFYRNPQKLEPLYVVSSVLGAVIVAIVLVFSSPEKTIFSSVATKELLVVGAVAFSISIVTCLLAVVMGAILCRRAHEKNVLQSDMQHKVVLYEMLPLLLYPMSFTVLGIPTIIFEVVVSMVAKSRDCDFLFTIEEVAACFTSLWSFAAPVSIGIHICVVLRIKKQKLNNSSRQGATSPCQFSSTDSTPTVGVTTQLIASASLSKTYFSLPVED